LQYDTGEGARVAHVGIQAQVAWELRTKRKIGSIADGVSMVDMVGLLLEQMKIDGTIPDGAVNEATLSRHLVDLTPVAEDDGEADPT
jgi:hypothetical protein